MANITLAFRKSPTVIDTLTLDANLSEKHDMAVDVTEHPVEEGADIADHMREKQDQVTIEGLISNTPIDSTQVVRADASRGLTSLQNGDAPGYAESAFAKLRALKSANTLITIQTVRRTYQNMKVISLSVPQDAKTGDALRFTATLKQIRIVKNKAITLAAVPKAKPKNTAGTKPTKAADSATANKSIAKKLADTDTGNALLKSIGWR